jgi:hypothetical protein
MVFRFLLIQENNALSRQHHGCSGAIFDAQLGEDMLDVLVDRARACAQ